MDHFKQNKRQKVFKTPTSYFNALENQLIAKIETESTVPVSWMDRMIYQLQLRFTIPATLVAILVGVIFYLDEGEVGQDDLSHQYFSDQAITAYMLSAYEDKMEGEIFKMVMETTGQDFELTDKEIMEYLQDNDSFDSDIEEYIQ